MADKQVGMRRWVFYPVLIISIFVVIIIWCFYWFQPVTTVLIVRHAERSSTPPNDPPLSTAGQARAQSLVHVAGEAGVAAIYATQFIRTQETVQPLATHLGILVNQIDAANTEGLADQVLSDHAGQVMIIAGHSNTVPQIIDELGGDAIPTIAENEFDNLFVVTVYRFGRAKVVHLNFGNPD